MPVKVFADASVEWVHVTVVGSVSELGTLLEYHTYGVPLSAPIAHTWFSSAAHTSVSDVFVLVISMPVVLGAAAVSAASANSSPSENHRVGFLVASVLVPANSMSLGLISKAALMVVTASGVSAAYHCWGAAPAG